MNLAKAIELLNHILRATPLRYDPDQRDAIKLGIEAGKEVIESRKRDPEFNFKRLPGETKD